MKPLVHWRTQSVSEYSLQVAILHYLGLRGVRAWITHSPRNRPTVAGVADIIGIMPGGRFLAVEVKTERGRVSKDQEQWLSEVEGARGLAVVARSVEDVERAIREGRVNET